MTKPIGTPTQEDLVEHWNGCAGAESIMNELRERAEQAERRVNELELAIAKIEVAFEGLQASITKWENEGRP